MQQQSVPPPPTLSREELVERLTAALTAFLEYFEGRLEPRQEAPQGLPEVLTIPDVARALKVSEASVKKLIRARKLPGARVGKLYRVRGEDLARYLEASKAASPTSRAPDRRRPREMTRAEFRAWTEKGEG